MIQTIRRWLDYMFGLWRQPHWWAEQWSSAVTIGWALSNLVGKSLDDRPTFAVMLDYASAATWEWVALGVGLFQLFALILNHRWLRAIAAFFCNWFFVIVLVSFVLGDTYPPSLALYAGYVGINLMAMYKLIRGTA